MVVRANRKRVFYLDLLKFVSIYAMIVCHLFYNYYSYTHESARGMIPGLMSMEKTLYLIVPGIFIFCLGGGLYLCRTKTWNYFVHRGFSLLAIGLILNVSAGSSRTGSRGIPARRKVSRMSFSIFFLIRTSCSSQDCFSCSMGCWRG